MGTGSLIFCVHNHQPVDNFDHVMEQVFEEAYLPFLEAMERHPSIKFCAHYSGPLLEWIEKNRLDLFIKIRNMIDRGRMELLSGGFYEPIFTMLPEADALGQIEMMNSYLRKHFGVEPKGLWLSERVWEPHLPSLLARTGLRYTVLDDFHFRTAGLREEELHGRFVTEDRGALFDVFPIKEELRYAIPFKDPQATLDYLARFPAGAPVVYADDGEKFGGWPQTHKHVYTDGWLERFLCALEGVRTTTFSECLEEPERGRIYLPACSYPEMGQWALLTQGRRDYEDTRRDLQERGKLDTAKSFLIGGLWRNFRVKYPEANLMYGRMLNVSRRVAETGNRKGREELYRAQCNCGYWHGVFGGLYLPHLRHAIYRHLIQADNEVESRMFGARMVDLTLDGREEVRLTNKALNLFVSPHRGAQILELDVRERPVNLGATLARRPEYYHEEIRERSHDGAGSRALQGGVRAKQAGLDRHLRYDSALRTSLVDRFFRPDEREPDGASDLGDFSQEPYSVRAGRRGDVLVASFAREGVVRSGSKRVPVRVEKEIALPEKEGMFQVAYTLRAREPVEAAFAVEFNIAMLNPEAFGAPEPDRVTLKVKDNWHDLDLTFVAAAASGYWIYPVKTVSQSDGGYELNYQCTAVVPYWRLQLEPERPWTGMITLKVDPR